MLIGPAIAAARPYDLPVLGASVELDEPWTLSSTADTDELTLADPAATAEVRVAKDSCADSMAIVAMVAATVGGRFAMSESWQPSGWYPAYAATTNPSGGAPRYHFCRDRHDRGSLSYAADADRAGVHGKLLHALEATLQVLGDQNVVYQFDTANGTLADRQNAYVEELKRLGGSAEPSGSEPTYSSEVAASPDDGNGGPEVPEQPAPVDDRSWYQRMSEREGRFEGVRLQLEYGNATIEGAPDVRSRAVASLRVPPRYRGEYDEHGLVYAGGVSVGALGGELIGDGHVALGAAFGRREVQLAALVVLGADRVIAGAMPVPVDSVYGGGRVLLRFPIGIGSTAFEASGTLVKGSHGTENRFDASLVTVHLAPLSAVLGVRRDSWDGGSAVSFVLGLGL